MRYAISLLASVWVSLSFAADPAVEKPKEDVAKATRKEKPAVYVAKTEGESLVTRIGKGQQYIVVSHRETPWDTGQRVCVEHKGNRIACGLVVQTNAKAAEVKITQQSQLIEEGDVALPGEKRELASVAPDSMTHTDVFVPHHYNTTAGLSIALDHMIPNIHFQGFVTPTVSAGIQASTLLSKVGTDTLTSPGLLFTLSYYSKGNYRGLWLQGGSGVFWHLQSGTLTHAPALIGTIGWREEWALGFNIGIGFGFRYIGPPKLSTGAISYNTINGVAVVDIGFNY